MFHDPAPLFQGSREEARAYLRGLGEGARYTYLLLRPDDTPFYVGKGQKLRMLEHEAEALRGSPLARSNPFKCNTIKRIVADGGVVGYRVDRLFDRGDEWGCLAREEALIARFRRRCDGGVLTNLAAGLGSASGRDPFSAERQAATLSGISEDRLERSALNLFLGTLGGLDSVPAKPLTEVRGKLVPAYRSPKALKSLSRRNGLTLAAAALASGLRLEPGGVIPRVFTLHVDPTDWPLRVPPPANVCAVIENGALSDVLRLGLATLVPSPSIEREAVTLDAEQIARLVAVLGRASLEDWGLL